MKDQHGIIVKNPATAWTLFCLEKEAILFFFNTIAQVIKLVDRVTHECASLFDTKPLHEPMMI